MQICVKKPWYFDWLTLGRPDRVKSSMFAFFASANVAKLFFKLFTLLTKVFLWCELKEFKLIYKMSSFLLVGRIYQPGIIL